MLGNSLLQNTQITETTLSGYLCQPLSIKNLIIPNRMVLAPMAGLGHVGLRHLISEYGGFGLLFSGMCNARAIPHENPKTSPVFKWREEELGSLVCQIFGYEPDRMAAAAIRIEQEGFFGVDLNFGCSVAAICKKGCGAALLKKPDLCSAIVKAVRNAVSIPVFVKFRIGWENDPVFAESMARRFEDAGADALTFHPRVAPDRRTRPPQMDVIRSVKESVSIPVFGNGNIFEEKDALRMLMTTSCQGISVGRMAVARPWLFAQWTGGLKPEKGIFYKTALRYSEILPIYYDADYSLRLFKKYAPYFCANFKFGHQFLKQLASASTLLDIRSILKGIFESDPEILSRPNINLFS